MTARLSLSQHLRLPLHLLLPRLVPPLPHLHLLLLPHLLLLLLLHLPLLHLLLPRHLLPLRPHAQLPQPPSQL